MPSGPYEKSLLEPTICLADESLFEKYRSYTLNYVRKKCGKHLRTVESYNIYNPVSAILAQIELEVLSEPDGWKLTRCIIAAHLKKPS
jgi:hypothetical protein